jgi:two-component system CheB/CheR fusion protein
MTSSTVPLFDRTKAKSTSPRKGRRSTTKVPFPIVGIGASAGGLEAFRRFLDAQTPTSGMAFVMIQHLDPTHPSLMAELLSNHTSMTVAQASDGAPPRPDHVYLIPPGTSLSISEGLLRISKPKEPHGARLPFDFFLGSLAEACGRRAVAVVLSGTGADGAKGLLAIKRMGGLVIAQDPQEADFDGMPRSAIATGAVDLIAPVTEIPDAVFRHFHPENFESPPAQPVNEPASDAFSEIIDLLREKTSHDFSVYKRGTLERRLAHRMGAAHVEDRTSYLELLRVDSGEAELLRQDLLIGVTQFFRDRTTFDFLAEDIIPDLVKQHSDTRPIRVWCPGCSTGEEPYSIAMLFLEAFAAAKRPEALQVFASDTNADAVAFARDGLYPDRIEADVGPARLARFFTKEDGHYRVVRELRDTVVFTIHDILTDAPFSCMDLVCCRNLLIYLQPEAQHKVLSFFHFALRDGGVLLLGESEAVGAAGRFKAVSDEHRVYRHVGRSRPGEIAFPVGAAAGGRALSPATAKPSVRRATDFDDLSRRALFETFALASVLIDAHNECLHFSGSADKYLKVASGAASKDVLAMAREGLRSKLRAAIERARRDHARTVVRGVRLETSGDETAVCFVVQPVMSDDEKMLLVSFFDDSSSSPKGGRSPAGAADRSRVIGLERELEEIGKELEAALQDLDSAKEEQKRINEQAMSLNEEAQSTNEELVTSKEELQSLNEELTALNSQLHETLERQRSTSNDLQNILESSGIATIFLDTNLRIRFFTPAAKSLFRVIATDIGRPLADFTSRTADSDLIPDASKVLTTLAPIEREVSTLSATWYNRLITPYRTHEGSVEGVVITFTDITDSKRAAEALAAAKQAADHANAAKSRFLAAASHDLRQPLQTIRLLQGLLATKSHGTDEQTLLKRLDAAVGAMSGMLNTLLDINQLEAGVIHAEIESFPLDELFEHLDSDFGYHMRAQGLDWRVVPSTCIVRSDPRLLEQILRNLLSNAVKFTTSGKVLLGCRRHGATTNIEVWDTGPGIPPEHRSAIFDEFRQIDNPARERSKGLGLGLAIVQRLSSLLGHPIDLRSRPGRGSMFSIAVPLATGAPTAAEPSRQKPSFERAVGDVTILVVEDDPTIRELLELLLRGAGYHPISVVDGVAALACSERPDLVVADFNLPNGPNGVEVIAELRRRFARKIPAIVLTGDISTETLHAIASRSCTHLDKPVETTKLFGAIAHLLGEPTQMTSPEETTEASGDAPLVNVFVVDDDAGVRETIRDMLEAHGWTVETFASCDAFLRALRPKGGGCLVIDALLPEMDGFELLSRLEAEKIMPPSIMITGRGDISMAVRAMQAGASDFLEKPFAREELIASITHALAQSRESEPSSERRAAAARLNGLTARQRQILALVLAGHPSKNIAADLGISQRTVENHRAAIMRKTGSRSIPALIRLAVAAG